ncbi:hypothetical protein ASD83_02595 [Devosia sp. Root685]|uniref:GNAT family N-acetyltransferase n=1 Tax=Devosia sp. Root685 TaxID=1736587 RepID=UPI0006F3EFF8|nr:GNAT family N-acetyltransferase [Devosia sp. Root685]KRA99428.1 hypothetical protein ASD83_02595 [Devosia sp. Root685]
MIVFRQAEQHDVARLRDLATETYVTAFGHSFEPSNLAAHLANNLSVPCFENILHRDVVLVAVQDDAFVGFLQFGHYEGGKAWEIRRVYVQSRSQNAGIGQRLMEQALRRPELSKAEDIYLDVWEENVAAQRFYRRFGFCPIGKREFRVASGEVTGSDLIMLRRKSRAA